MATWQKLKVLAEEILGNCHMAEIKHSRRLPRANLWLACWTEEEIAEAVGAPQQTVSDQTKELPKLATWPKSVVLAEYREPEWTPPPAVRA